MQYGDVVLNETIGLGTTKSFHSLGYCELLGNESHDDISPPFLQIISSPRSNLGFPEMGTSPKWQFFQWENEDP